MKPTLLFLLLLFSAGAIYAQAPGEFESVRNALRDPTKVEILDLSGQRASVIDKKLAECVNMEELILDGMHLEAVPGFIKSLKHLKDVSLTDNKLTKLPGWLMKLPNLESLDIRGNEIPEEGVENLRDRFDEINFLTD